MSFDGPKNLMSFDGPFPSWNLMFFDGPKKLMSYLFFPLLKPHVFWWTQNLMSFNGPFMIFWVHQKTWGFWVHQKTWGFKRGRVHQKTWGFGSIKRHEVSGGETKNGSIKVHEIQGPSKDMRFLGPTKDMRFRKEEQKMGLLKHMRWHEIFGWLIMYKTKFRSNKPIKVYRCRSPHMKSVIIYKDCHHFSHYI